jgi:hypothetical protein
MNVDERQQLAKNNGSFFLVLGVLYDNQPDQCPFKFRQSRKLLPGSHNKGHCLTFSEEYRAERNLIKIVHCEASKVLFGST